MAAPKRCRPSSWNSSHADAANKLRDIGTEGDKLVETEAFYYERQDNSGDKYPVHHCRDRDVERHDTALFILTARCRRFLGPEKGGGAK